MFEGLATSVMIGVAHVSPGFPAYSCDLFLSLSLRICVCSCEQNEAESNESNVFLSGTVMQFSCPWSSGISPFCINRFLLISVRIIV